MAARFITQQSDLESVIPILMSRNRWGFDTETTGLDPFKNKVILAQIGDDEDQFVIDTRMVNIEPLRPFFESEDIYKVGHNLKFDARMLKGNYKIDIERPWCTFLSEKVLANGLKFKGFGLDDVLDEYLGVQVDKALQKSFIGHEGPFSQAQIDYALTDIKHLLRLSSAMNAKARSQDLMKTIALECGALPCFVDMEMHGLLLDQKKWTGIADAKLVKAKEIAKELDEFAKPFCQIDLFGDVDVNYASPVQVVEILNRMGIKALQRNPKTGEMKLIPIVKSDDATLKKVKGSRVVDLIKQYRSLMTRYGTFGQSFIEAIHPLTGRIHTDFDQIGTETGRIAKGKSPINMLNIPREKDMRNCFIAPEDYVIETDDYSGCELRIWAHISQDPELCGALQRGEDLHCYVATKLYKKPVTKTENKELRTPAKSLNFGRPEGFAASSEYSLCA